MTVHVYRANAVEQARQQGWVGFWTGPDRDGMWKVRYEPGDNPADEYAATVDWATHGEVRWVPGGTEQGPLRAMGLVVRVRYEELAELGEVVVDSKLARVWLIPHGQDHLAAKATFLVEPMDSDRWHIFTPKVGAGQPAGHPASNAATADAPGRAPSRPARSAATVTSPIRERSTAESPVKRVWAMADAMPGATRAQVVAACVEQGINKSTAGTQYYHWSKARAQPGG